MSFGHSCIMNGSDGFSWLLQQPGTTLILLQLSSNSTITLRKAAQDSWNSDSEKYNYLEHWWTPEAQSEVSSTTKTHQHNCWDDGSRGVNTITAITHLGSVYTYFMTSIMTSRHNRHSPGTFLSNTAEYTGRNWYSISRHWYHFVEYKSSSDVPNKLDFVSRLFLAFHKLRRCLKTMTLKVYDFGERYIEMSCHEPHIHWGTSSAVWHWFGGQSHWTHKGCSSQEDQSYGALEPNHGRNIGQRGVASIHAGREEWEGGKREWRCMMF